MSDKEEGVVVGRVYAKVEHPGSSSEAFGFDGVIEVIEVEELVYVAVGRKGESSLFREILVHEGDVIR